MLRCNTSLVRGRNATHSVTPRFNLTQQPVFQSSQYTTTKTRTLATQSWNRSLFTSKTHSVSGRQIRFFADESKNPQGDDSPFDFDSLTPEEAEIVAKLQKLQMEQDKELAREVEMPAEERKELEEEQEEERERDLEELEEGEEGIENAEFLVDGEPLADEDADGFEFPMPYYENYKQEAQETSEMDLDDLTNETEPSHENSAVLFAQAAAAGEVDPSNLFRTVPIDDIWTALRNLDEEAMEGFKDDFQYHILPDMLFLDDADFLMPEPNPKLWGPELYEKYPAETRWADFVWFMHDLEDNPYYKRREEAVNDYRQNFVPSAVSKRIWELHKTDQRFWTYDRLARTFGVKRPIVKGICYLKEEEEAEQNNLPFDKNKNLKMFKWERKSQTASDRRAFQNQNISQEEAYKQYVEAMSKPEDFGEGDFLPLFQGALQNSTKKAQAEIRKLNDIESKAGLGTMKPRSKFVFVEVGRHVNDKNRRWVIRDMDGTLRTASSAEREFVTSQHRSRAFGKKKYL